MLIRIAFESLRHRFSTVLLTLISVMISVTLLVSVEFTRTQLKESFTRTVSGVDLIVGARTSPINLLLYSVFRIGNASNSIDWHLAEEIDANPLVKWTIPVSLGDSHRGFRVVGTDNRYFEFFRYGLSQPLKFSQGQEFNREMSAVLGADAASALGYKIGDQITLSHGISEVSFVHHNAHPLTITGILEASGTPVDQALYVSLGAIEAMHATAVTTRSVRKTPKPEDLTQVPQDHAESEEHHEPETITALLVGLNNRAAALQLQYQLNQNDKQPVTAILPGMTLAELWQMMSQIENILRGIVLAIFVTALLGLVTLQLATMNARKREFALLRTLGASPFKLLLMIEMETLLVSACASLGGVCFTALTFTILNPWLTAKGLIITDSLLNHTTLLICAGVVIVSAIAGLVPAWIAFRSATHATLTER